MQLTELRHINFTLPEVPAPGPGGTEPGHSLRTRKVNRSPAEEFAARTAALAVDGLPPFEPLPAALAALVMQHQRELKVTREGLKMTILGEDYVYWSESAQTTHPANVGKKVLVTYDRDDLDAVHVIAADGRYVETIPLKKAAPWFSTESWDQTRAARRVIDRVHDNLKKLHGPTTRARARRCINNAETLQAVNTFPIPESDEAARSNNRERINSKSVGSPSQDTGNLRAPKEKWKVRFHRAEDVLLAAERVRVCRERYQREHAVLRGGDYSLDELMENERPEPPDLLWKETPAAIDAEESSAPADEGLDELL